MLGPRMKCSTSAEVRIQPHTDDATSAGILAQQNDAGRQCEVSELAASWQLMLYCRDRTVFVPTHFQSGRKKSGRTMGTLATIGDVISP